MTDRITFPSNTVGRPNSIQSYAVNLPFRLNQRRHVNGKRVNNSASKKDDEKETMRKWCAMYPICQHLNSIIECRRYWESPFANMTSARCRSASVESRVTARAAVASRSRREYVNNLMQ